MQLYSSHSTRHTKDIGIPHGSALLPTLLIITVLTTIILLLLGITQLNLLTNTSFTAKTRSTWAAQAALNQALSQLITAVSRPDNTADRTFITYQLEAPNSSSDLSPILMINRQNILYPLISTSLTQITANNQTAQTNLFQTRQDINLNQTNIIQHTDPQPNFTAQALPLNSGTKSIARYAFQILDEQARLDPRLHRAQPRDTLGQDATEIPLTNLTGKLLTPAEQTKLLSFPFLPDTPLSFALAIQNYPRREELKHLFGLHEANNEDVIPAGLAEVEKPKYNLNHLATDKTLSPTQRAEKIADIIDKNLPDFKNRDPSLANESPENKKHYLNRLAASIVDYIDPNTICTAVNQGEPAGRGLFPMVVGIAEQYQWLSETLDNNGFYTAVIQTRIYAQVWNPYTTTVSGEPGITVTNRQRINYGSGIVTPLNDYHATTQPITIYPNEFKVIAFAPDTQIFTSPTKPNNPYWQGSPNDSADQSTHEPFEFFWNHTRVDMQRRAPVNPGIANSGMVRNAKKLELNKIHYQVCTIPTFSNENVVGDPRITYLSNYDWSSVISTDATYEKNTYWNGRNPREEFPFNQNFTTTWAQRDFIRANPSPGKNPEHLTTAPDQVPSTYNKATDAPNAPFFIRKNAMHSIAELGNIFDPAQANNEGIAAKGGSPASVFVAGGGRTLRIGQPEFSYWDQDGLRALELLDLFTLNPVNPHSNYPEIKGRINLNTAPKEVLEALLANIEIKTDQAPDNNDPTKISRLDATKLADAIIAERKKSPFRKISDLNRILPFLARADAYQPKLGQGPDDQAPLVMDRAREEAFAKFCNLITLQSRNYRIIAAGQALAPNGSVTSTTYLEAIVSLETETTPNQQTIFKPKLTYVHYY